MSWPFLPLTTVEKEVECLMNNSYLVAKQFLDYNHDLLEQFLTQTWIDQEVVLAEQFQIILIEFQAKTIDYKVLGKKRNPEKLPFQPSNACFCTSYHKLFCL
jgi:hypothetical protein